MHPGSADEQPRFTSMSQVRRPPAGGTFLNQDSRSFRQLLIIPVCKTATPEDGHFPLIRGRTVLGYMNDAADLMPEALKGRPNVWCNTQALTQRKNRNCCLLSLTFTANALGS